LRPWQINQHPIIFPYSNPTSHSEAAKAVAEQVSPSDLEVGLIYPPQSEILKTSLHVAQKVAEVIFARNLAGVPKPSDLHAFIESQVYKPEYRSLLNSTVHQ
jgi:malate dehydrogenase (oxaloacetate-decarboxylating)(NADP+)